jgi:CTP synthase
VTGGVVSSIGKGISASSIGAILEDRGLKVTMVKMDPYINVDPGTMNPFQHGEVFVTDDGAETDLDIGHYERFTSGPFTKRNNFTTGKVYHSVISKERKGVYLGGTVQVVPHITNEIKERIRKVSHKVDIVIAEVGGTVGDIESLPFLEAIRQMRVDEGPENVLYIHVTLVPFITASGEVKTKPTQHSVKELQKTGIQPDIIICRSQTDLSKSIKEKIGLYCNVQSKCVITALDVSSVYEVPVQFHKEGLDEIIVERLNIWTRSPDMKGWKALLNKTRELRQTVRIGIVGKYVNLTESYKSLTEALFHAGLANATVVQLVFIDSETMESGNCNEVSSVHGILVPGGFGNRGIEGKVAAIRFARESRVPFFGICLGMHTAAIEFARNVCHLKNANSEEFDASSPHKVIHFLLGQNELLKKGATMRLGAYACRITEGSRAMAAYGKDLISERHRHRYEFNNEYFNPFGEKGMGFSGINPESNLVEIMELTDHPWFLGCQFHPEFKSKPMQSHPLFRDFIKSALEFKKSR